MKSCDFYCKRHFLAWIHVDWAILRENRLRGLTSRAVGENTQKVSDSHRNDASPLTQGLRYRAACDNKRYFKCNSKTLVYDCQVDGIVLCIGLKLLAHRALSDVRPDMRSRPVSVTASKSVRWSYDNNIYTVLLLHAEIKNLISSSILGSKLDNSGNVLASFIHCVPPKMWLHFLQ